MHFTVKGNQGKTIKDKSDNISLSTQVRAAGAETCLSLNFV